MSGECLNRRTISAFSIYTRILLLAAYLIVLGSPCFAAQTNDSIPEITVIIKARPSFERDEKFKMNLLVIECARYRYSFPYSGGPADDKFLPELDTNQVYTFTVMETPRRNPYDTNLIFFHQDLCRIEAAGKTVYDHEICEVHHVKMDFKTVPIIYALLAPAPSAPDFKTQRALFPHLNEYVAGGCVSNEKSPKTSQTYVCSECKKQFAKWMAEHKNASPKP